jgi:hypothetical protein
MKNFAKNTGLIIGSILVCLIVFEAGLRIIDYSHPSKMQMNNLIGWNYIPGIEGWYTREGKSYIRINSDGFNAPEFSVEKPNDVFRIVVLGDSQTASMQIDYGDHFASVLEKNLSHCRLKGIEKVEVYPFGVNNFNSVQQLIALEKIALKYKPDMVILAFFVGNDLVENTRQGHFRFMPFAYLEDGELVIDDSELKSDAFLEEKRRVAMRTKLINATRLGQLLKEAYLRAHIIPQMMASGTEVHAPKKSAPGLTIADRPEAWKLAETLFLKFRELSQQNGAEFVIAPLWTSPGIIKDEFSDPNLIVGDIGKKHGIPVIPVTREISRRVQASGVDVYSFGGVNVEAGHYNENGHAIIGETIGDFLCPEFVGEQETPDRQ